MRRMHGRIVTNPSMNLYIIPRLGNVHRRTIRRTAALASRLLGIAIVAIVARIEVSAAESRTIEPMIATPLPKEGKMPTLDRATEWINSAPLTAADLRGKVVLVDFWTYT